MSPRISTLLITGALGSGKTSLIRHLLKERPEGERWAVLVNEFGEVGIDGAILGQASDVAVKEIAGGCICCSAQASLRVALTRLIREVRPDRLLIEPTGLGHPAGILDILRDPWMQQALSIEAVVTVFDPRLLLDARWQENRLAREQLDLADIVILNKIDLSEPPAVQAAMRYVADLYPPKAGVFQTTNGVIDLSQLQSGLRPYGQLRSAASVESPPDNLSWGRVFAPETIFSRPAVEAFFRAVTPTGDGGADAGVPMSCDGFVGTENPGVALVRAKGILRFGKEWSLLNWTPDGLALEPVSYRRDSRIEFIAATQEVDWSAVDRSFSATIAAS